jgi:hypothetical protein
MTTYLSIRFGERVTHSTLLKFALSLAKGYGLKVDREARRRKEILITWFCEHALDLLHSPAPGKLSIMEHPAIRPTQIALPAPSPPPVPPPNPEPTSMFELFERSKELMLEEEELLRWG